MKKVIFLLSILFQFIVFSQSQKTSVDSVFITLEKQLNSLKYQEVVSYKLSPLNLTINNASDSLHYSKILHIKADAYYELNKYDKAIALSNEALKYLQRSENDLNQKGVILFDRAFSEYALKRYKVSYNTVKSAEKVLSNLKNPNYDYLVSIYADLSSSATHYGFFDEAEYYLKKGFELYQLHKDKIKIDKSQASKEVVINHKLIYLYHNKGDEVKMLSVLKDFDRLKNSRTFNDKEKRFYSMSLNHIGDFYLSFRDSLQGKSPLKKGKYYLEKALRNIDKKQQLDDYITVKYNLAKLFIYSKQFNTALKENEWILHIAKPSDFRRSFFYAQRSLIYAEKGDKKKAIEQLYLMASSIHSGKEKLNKNATNFSPSSDIDHTGLLVEAPFIILKFYPNDKELLKLSSLFFKMGLQQFKNCYQGKEFSEKLKNYYHLTLKGLLKTQKLGFGHLKNNDLLNEIENIENKLAWKEFLFNRNYANQSIPDSIVNKGFYLSQDLITARKDNDTTKILEIQNSLKKHRLFLRDNYPNISKSIANEFNVSGFQKKLSKNELVLRYKRIEDSLYVFKVTHDTIDIKSITYDAKFSEDTKNFLKLLKERKNSREFAKNIYNKLFPFKVKDYKKITIVPDAILYQLPFEALITNTDEYLIENHIISYASDLIFIKPEYDTDNTANSLQLYTPIYDEDKELGGAIEETNFITDLFKSKTFAGEEANKNNFLQESSEASILHLATHATIDNKKPELSHFLFNNNENLYIEELYALKLKANLAVLSACNTANGSLSNTYKGAVSLQRAFTFAGVSSTVSSLWKAPDKETTMIMQSFYENLKKGKSKSEALQLAKKQYLTTVKDELLLSPYYWAGFIVNGDINPLTEEKDYTFLIILGLSLVSMLVVLRKRIYNFFKTARASSFL